MKNMNLTIGILALGIVVCLTGAALMAFGEGLLGENHTGIATVIGIVGIGIISTSGAPNSKILNAKKKGQQETCAK
jgi:hypothetical protein